MNIDKKLNENTKLNFTATKDVKETARDSKFSAIKSE